MSNVTAVYDYPEDTMGTAVTNKITGEQQIVLAASVSDYHFVVPKFAPFYAKMADGTPVPVSIKGTDNSVRNLTLGKDFIFTHRFIDASLATAQDIFGSITFLDATLAGVVTIGYQTVGGQWTLDDAAWTKLMGDKVHNPRITSWDSVVYLPASFPAADHPHPGDDMVGMSEVRDALAGIATVMAQQGNNDLADHINNQNNPHKVTAQQTGAYTRDQSDQSATNIVSNAVAAHVAAADPHGNYLTSDRATALIGRLIGAVRTPTNLTPAAAATNVSQTVTLIGNPYYTLYGPAQSAAQFQVSRQQDFAANIVVDSGTLGPVQQYAITAGLQANAAYFWRCRYRDSEGTWSAWSSPTAFSTGSIIVNQPAITSPASGSVGVNTAVLLQSSAFGVTGGSDTHASSDWEIWTGPNGTGTRAVSLQGSTSNKTSYQVAGGNLGPNLTYYARVRYTATGAGTSAWSNDCVFTTAGVVAQPSITSPSNGDTGILDGFTLKATAFAVQGGTDTQASADWQIWSGPNGTGTKVYELLGSATDKTATTVPLGKLSVSTTYYARTRQNGTALGASAWSNDVMFTTAAQFFPTVAGQAFGGGFFAGNIKEPDGATYAIIVAPKATGQTSSLPYNANTNAGSRVDGFANTNAYANNTGSAPAWARTLTIGGYNDWYLPALDELEVIYRNLKPDTTLNIAASGAYTYNPDGKDGINPNSVPVGAAYTPSNPAQTSVALFQSGGSEAFPNILCSSTKTPNAGDGTGTMYVQYFGTNQAGNQSLGSAGSPLPFRAIRKVKVSS